MTEDNKKPDRIKYSKVSVLQFWKNNSTIIITLLVIALVLFIFIPQISNLKETLSAVKTANKKSLVLAILIFCSGFIILAYKYVTISPVKLKYWLTLQVEIACAFISKLLPSSVGSLTVNTYYLTKETQSVSKASSTMALNAITSSIAFAFIIGFGLFGNLGFIGHIFSNPPSIHWPLVVFIVLIILFIGYKLATSKRLLKKINDGKKEFWENLKKYKSNPEKIVGGVLLNGLGTLTGIATLYICTHSVGLNVTFSEAILSYTLGNIVGGLVPTPGGLGGAEAGLYGGLVFFGYDANLSLVAVLIYRFITYWLPLIPGYIMYHHLRKTTFSNFSLKKSSSN